MTNGDVSPVESGPSGSSRPRYSPPQKKALQKTGEFFQTVGTGVSGLTAAQLAFADQGALGLPIRAAFVLIGLAFVVLGIYLQAEAER